MSGIYANLSWINPPKINGVGGEEFTARLSTDTFIIKGLGYSKAELDEKFNEIQGKLDNKTDIEDFEELNNNPTDFVGYIETTWGI